MKKWITFLGCVGVLGVLIVYPLNVIKLSHESQTSNHVAISLSTSSAWTDSELLAVEAGPGPMSSTSYIG